MIIYLLNNIAFYKERRKNFNKLENKKNKKENENKNILLKNNNLNQSSNSYKTKIKKKKIQILATNKDEIIDKSYSFDKIIDIEVNDDLKYTNLINTYNDYELNTMSYKEAIKLDKRKYIEFYFSLLRKKQLLIFTFYTSNDYNSRYIKICLFFFHFSLNYTINALFFSDPTMHKIYMDQGEFNFIYQLPQILYSVIINSIINAIITFLSLTEKNIIKIKNDNKLNKEKLENTKNDLRIKFILFFILIYIFLGLFWYYISCFCAIYKNTQLYLIKDTLISYTFSLIYPFGIYLIPGIFRIFALKSLKQDKECIYKISKFLQLI